MRLVKRIAFCAPLLALLGIIIGLPSVAVGSDATRNFRAMFLGVNETPSINTDAAASLKLRINGSGTAATIDYTLTYSDLRADATQAHIHFAQSKVMGGIVVYLCKTTQTDAPAGTPTCPARAGTVSGTLTSAAATNK